MSKKTLDLVIELTKELYKFDTSSYIPIKHKKINIGWIHKNNSEILKFLKKENDFIDAKQVSDISKDKNFYAKKGKKNLSSVQYLKIPQFLLKKNFIMKKFLV